jgi:hypothetical protein
VPAEASVTAVITATSAVKHFSQCLRMNPPRLTIPSFGDLHRTANGEQWLYLDALFVRVSPWPTWCEGSPGPGVGARFVGRNTHPVAGQWETTCTLVGYQPECLFAWEVVVGWGRVQEIDNRSGDM